jgi:hypothetical protein
MVCTRGPTITDITLVRKVDAEVHEIERSSVVKTTSVDQLLDLITLQKKW